jgi:hypothetical protein
MRSVARTRKAYMKPPHVSALQTSLTAYMPSGPPVAKLDARPSTHWQPGAVERPGGDSERAAGVASSA